MPSYRDPMKEAIERFWHCFLDRKSEVENMASADDPAYDEILAVLQEIDPGLFFQFSTAPGQNELVITAEGEMSLFPLVEEVVSLAPAVEGWTILSLKPKLGFPLWTTWEGTRVTIGAVRVLPVFKQSGEMGLRLYVPDLTDANEDHIHNALLRALDAGLGERQFAEKVSATWVYPAAEAPDQAFPLVELDDYLKARE